MKRKKGIYCPNHGRIEEAIEEVKGTLWRKVALDERTNGLIYIESEEFESDQREEPAFFCGECGEPVEFVLDDKEKEPDSSPPAESDEPGAL